jgi:hypothetical protein
MPHSDLYSDYRVAKRAAAVPARASGAVLLQTPKGKPRVILGKQAPRDFPTWLAAWSWLHSIRQDQIRRQAPVPRQVPTARAATPPGKSPPVVRIMTPALPPMARILPDEPPPTLQSIPWCSRLDDPASDEQ